MNETSKTKNPKPIEPYLKINYSVFKVKKVVFGARVLFAYFNGFGLKGCWQTDDQIAEVFGVGIRTISDWVRQLKKAEAVIVWAAKSRYRRIWSKSQYTKRLKTAEGKKFYSAISAGNSADSAFNSAKNCSVTPQDLRTISNDIIKKDNSIASPSPSPNEASASADKGELEQLKANVFGRKANVSTSPAQKEANRKRVLEQLGVAG